MGSGVPGVITALVKGIRTATVLENATVHPPLMVVVTAVDTIEKYATVMNAPTTMEGVDRNASIIMGPTPAHAVQITNLQRIGRNVSVSLKSIIYDVCNDV